MQLRLEGPAWETEAAAAAAPTLPAVEQMMAWGVDQLAEFLAQQDLHGQASSIISSGVAGADLMAWTAASALQADLKITPFAARKVLAARDQFLGQKH